MKKTIYLLLMTVSAVFMTSCDPMEDIYADLDAQENVIVGETKITLSDDDYDDLGLSFGNFNSVDDAKSMIPGLLNDKFPVWGNGSLAEVTFKWYNPKDTYSENIYELSDDDHNAITGNTYGNFDSGGDIYDYLEANYPDAVEEDFVSLRYRYYSNGETTLTDGFYFENASWNKIAGFTEAQYNEMGESFPNFTSHDEAEVKIPIALLDVYKYDQKEAGDIVQTMYELYKGGGVTKSYTSNYIFDGQAFSKYNNVANETIQFGHDGTGWIPDNTIRYDLTSADVALLANELSSAYPGPTSNVLAFGSFDRRAGGGNYWSDDMLLEAFNIVLNNLNPSAEEGQKYVVKIIVYIGALADEEFSLIKTGGVWVVNN